ncbi:hypothetical protein LLG88_01490 [bacterium]|nr:hypothetical protein [bacterium]
MGLFGHRWSAKRPGVEVSWLVPLPRRVAPPAADAPRCILCGDMIVAWGERHAVGVDVSLGRIAFKAKFGPWRPCGFDAAGRLVLGRGDELAAAYLDPVDGRIVESSEAQAERVLEAQDAPEAPELDPTLPFAGGTLRVRTETVNRVTRHMLEVADGAAPRRLEVAAFTLRSDRLILRAAGPRLYGWVGGDPECPTGALAAFAGGPYFVLRRRHAERHEHFVPEDFVDVVGHGDAPLVAVVLPEGGGAPREVELGIVPEVWRGLGRRDGSRPTYVERALGARPIGVLGRQLLVEFVELEGGKPHSARGLQPRRRSVAGFDASALLD